MKVMFCNESCVFQDYKLTKLFSVLQYTITGSLEVEHSHRVWDVSGLTPGQRYKIGSNGSIV